jgi:beta-glucanase (GH16 family)
VVARAPAGTGTWPAAWLLNDRYRSDRHGLRCDWPLCGEIDILEFAGSNPGEYHFTAHTAKYNHVLETQLTKIQSIREVDPEFHEFVLDWRPEVLTFYMDGQEVNRVEKSDPSFEAWPFDERYYLILNLAIGGGFGGRKGVDSEIFPSRYEIKSVRIYQ